MKRYSSRGVSASKKDVHNAIKDLDKGLYPNAFAKILPDYLGGDDKYCNIIHSDGAGTKSALAYAYWKETDDMSVWAAVAQDALVMNIDDLLCVGVYDNILISSIIGRNRFKIPGKVISAIINGVEAFISQMKKYDVNIFSGGGETADIGDLVRTITIDITATARLPRDNIINVDILPSDVIVGFSSFGKALYEKEYNYGIGSNGLTLARHELFNKKVAEKYPETFAPEIDNELIYSGKYFLTDKIDDVNIPIAKMLLSPTRTYLPIMKQIIPNYGKRIHGIIHCTGGGQAKVLNFIENLRIVKNNLFDIPLIFRLIQASGNVSWQEMYRVFNMGHRLEIYTDQNTALKIIDIAKHYGVEAKIIGYVEKSSTPNVVIKSEYGEFVYEK